jgi:DNA-binding NarL/FixJ family response regulator
MSALHPCVLVVEDEFLIAQGICLQVEEIGLPVCATVATAEAAVAAAVEHRPMIVLMDVRLQGLGDGVDAALAIHEHVGSKVIFVTGSREPATLERIHQDHPAGLLFTPVSERQLRNALEAVGATWAAA